MTDQQTTETRDLEAARRGDRAAFARLYEEWYPAVYRYARFNSRTTADAEDLAAEAFARALAAVSRFRGTAAELPAWLFRIARNAAIDRARRTRPTTELVELEGGDPTSPLADRLDIRQALAQLTQEQRSVILLRFAAGLSTRETAVAVGRREKAVESLQHRALEALARRLSPR
ncbi:MAG TPA: sigma-70 family RNA polymerase sigma factor [Candidatus Limnocylindria bacterium]|nr:sigma-70 family RNA polymerase sigma factor [Candidatus Limnocylindria bacterium]